MNAIAEFLASSWPTFLAPFGQSGGPECRGWLIRNFDLKVLMLCGGSTPIRSQYSFMPALLTIARCRSCVAKSRFIGAPTPLATRIARWNTTRSSAWPVGNANIPSGKPPQIAQSQILRRVTGGRSPLWADHSFTSFVSVLYFGDASAMGANLPSGLRQLFSFLLPFFNRDSFETC